MPSLAVMDDVDLSNNSEDNVKLPSTTISVEAKELKQSENDEIVDKGDESSRTPTSKADKTSQPRSTKKINVTPQEDTANTNTTSKSTSGRKPKRMKNQPTLAAFFGAKKAGSTTAALTPTVSAKRKQVTPVQSSPGADGTNNPGATSGAEEKTSGESSLKPRNIFPSGKEKTASPKLKAATNKKKDSPTKKADSNKKKVDSLAVATGESSVPAGGSPLSGTATKLMTKETKLKAHTVDTKNDVIDLVDSDDQSADVNNATTTGTNSDPVEPELPEERILLLQKHQEMRKRYTERASSLIVEAQEGIEEENFEMPSLMPLPEECPSDQEYPDAVVANMAVLIEGSSLPLSQLVTKVCETLEEHHGKKWPTESIDAKIKILAKRKPTFNVSSANNNNVDIFEDENPDRMWRWEIITIDVLPAEAVAKVRRARAARKKFSSNHSALLRLLQTLENAETSIRDMKIDNFDKLSAKISLDEEKVLKFEREAEKKRLAEQAKRMKQSELDAKKKEKEKQAEEKRREKELKKQEAEKKKIELETKKQEQAEAREAAKRQKIEERERQEEEKKRLEEQQKEILNKQKKCLMSFFASPKPKNTKHSDSNASLRSDSSLGGAGAANTVLDSFDVDKFRSLIDSFESHAMIPQAPKETSTVAIESRKRKTGKVDVSVYVTVFPDQNNPFDAQPFAEQKILRVPNKYRFLSFHEDHRPPYHGTWSKKSYVISGRRPFAKDTACLDYDYDSEAEWEEGDDEMGEDVEDETKNQEEEMEEADDRIYDYDDGFCVADDQYLDTDENVDEEDKELYKKRLQSNQVGGAPAAVANKICIIAPSANGTPLNFQNCSMKRVDGLDKQEGRRLFEALRGQVLNHSFVYCDSIPPPLDDDGEAKMDVDPTSNNQNSTSDDYTKEEMVILAKFIHLNTLNSKEKIVEELRKDHLSSFNSRAKATRKLDSIATKKRRRNATGVYWEVKKEVLEELGLEDLVVESEEEVVAELDPEKPKNVDSKQSSTPQAKKKKGKKRAQLDSLATCTTKPEKKARMDDKTVSKPEHKTPTNASANLLANFLIRPKKKPKDTPEGQDVVEPPESA